MTQTSNRTSRNILAAAAAALALGMVGCSATRPADGLSRAEPAGSVFTIATADDTFVAGTYSLVAADSIGLATFGEQIVLDDLRARDDRFAEAN
ncbi:MAG: hypothetical protein ACE37H_18420 [Phycisphaeraceae bacterium]